MADPTDAARYNGQQADMWDMQKDIFLAGIGSLLAFPWVVCRPMPN